MRFRAESATMYSFYSAVLIVDMFRFSNSYAALPSIADIAQYGDEDDEGVTDLRSECEAYVYNGNGEVPPVPFATLLLLYSHLQAGTTISAWIEAHSIYAKPIDVRRMVQFGVIKGFLRRAHAYPIWLDHPRIISPSRKRRQSSSGKRPNDAPSAGQHGASPDPRAPGGSSFFAMPAASTSNSDEPLPRRGISPTTQRAHTRRAGSPHVHHSTPPTGSIPLQSGASYPASLPNMLDGSHHVDEICVKYGVSLRQLDVVLRELGGASKSDSLAPEDDDGQDGQRRTASSSIYGNRLVMMYV